MIERQSRATSMGFTPIDGLVMGERPGAVDPGIILFLFEELGYECCRSAQRSVQGKRAQGRLRHFERHAATAGQPRTTRQGLAIDLYVYRAVREVGAIAAEIGGVEAFVFTAGIGENAPRSEPGLSRAAAGLACDLDASRNAAHEQCISPDDARVGVYVIPTNEEAVIARETRSLLMAGPG